MRMALIVQKYGGTSVGDAERIRAVAQHVASTRADGHEVVVVVSAMGKFTDDLVLLADQVSPNRPDREMDMLLTAGERISMALVSMALSTVGVESASFTGSQAGIITDTSHTRAKILEIRPDRIREALDDGLVPVVAGFQGVSIDRDITTLGRGGSDVTAVAFDEMMEIAATGGRVLMLRSVELARRHRVSMHVRSSFTWEPGTWIVEEDPTMEEAIVSAITDDTSEAKITVAGVPDRPGVAATLFRELANDNINVDMIVQNTGLHNVTDISFTVAKTDLEAATKACQKIQKEIDAATVTSDDRIGRVSLVGAGMKSSPGVTALMFETLYQHGINIEMISTSSIRISCVLHADKVAEAVRVLHHAFGLDAE
jgi:aspartate kinase